jgi:transcriptional regulator with XRE-family HTH domain
VKEKLAERIRLSRLSKGLSQQNVADELGITVAAYSNIERGITDISVSRVFQIAAILEVNAMVSSWNSTRKSQQNRIR